MARSDEKLLKLAYGGAKNLKGLGILASLGAVMLGLMAVNERHGLGSPGLVLTAGMVVIAFAYFVLSAAARRGDQRALAVVIVLMVFQLAISAVGAAIRPGESQRYTTYPVMVVCLLILLVLLQNYKVLVELRRRGLWMQVFGSCPPAGHLCMIGGSVLVAAFLSVTGVAFYEAHQLKGKLVEREHANAFVRMLENEEKDFLSSMRPEKGSRISVDAAMDHLTKLEQRLAALKSESAGIKELSIIAAKYGEAVSEWKAGLQGLSVPKPDFPSIQNALRHGDELRTETIADYNRIYADPARARGSSK